MQARAIAAILGAKAKPTIRPATREKRPWIMAPRASPPMASIFFGLPLRFAVTVPVYRNSQIHHSIEKNKARLVVIMIEVLN